MITCPCKVYPLHPTSIYVVKLGFTGVYIIFLLLLYYIDCAIICGYSLEPPQRVPTIYVLSKTKKNITIFHLKIITFIAVKYCGLLHGHNCVMESFRQNPVYYTCHKNVLYSPP